LRDASSPYGYSGPVSSSADTGFCQRASTSLIETLRADQIVTCFSRLHPLLLPPLDALRSGGEVLHHGETVAVDLEPDDEVWLTNISHGHRRDFRQFCSLGNEVLFDRWEHWDPWVDAYHENMRRVHANSYYFFSQEYLASMRDRLGRHAHLATAHSATGDFMGGSLILEYDGLVQQFLLGVRDEYLRAHAAPALFIETRRWARARGNRVQHLGGGRGGINDSLFHFKRQFSTWTPPFYTWRVVTDASAYADLTTSMQSGNGSNGGNGAGHPDFFPAYRGSDAVTAVG
jgi:hypothetical protein